MDELAIIKLYTMEIVPRESSFYARVNETLRTEQRDRLKPWVPCIWLLMHALKKCPRPEGGVVFRGVKEDLSGMFKEGARITWPSFSSCTSSMKVLSNSAFLGYAGPRTMFTIELTQGRARLVSALSMIAGEDEVLLPPNSRFTVVSVLGPSADGRLDVHLREIKPLDPILSFDP